MIDTENKGDTESLTEVESLIETDRHDEAESKLAPLQAQWAEALAEGILRSVTSSKVSETEHHQPGYMVFNPSGVSRRAAVVLPDAAMDLRPAGPLRVAQFTEDGVCAVVDLPPFGFAWVPKDVKPRGFSCSDEELTDTRPQNSERIYRNRV